MEYKLATLNEGGYVPRDDPTVAQFKAILDHLDRECPESREHIGDMIYLAHTMLKEKGVNVSILKVATDLKSIVPRKANKSVKCAGVAAAYVTMVNRP